MSTEKRIYVVVAETVHSSLVEVRSESQPYRTLVLPTVDTKTIVQPKGRIAAQVAHVVSKMRLGSHLVYGNEIYPTIILSVPDSYQLHFRAFLLGQTETGFYSFRDTNEEYGLGEVLTAICTVPVKRAKLGAAFDYLNLWS